MDAEADRDYFKAEDIGSSLKARQVRLESNGKQFWVPISVSEWHRHGILMVESWFARKEGML